MRVTGNRSRRELFEIGYVGESYRKCEGVGHYARECATPRGKGEGSLEVGSPTVQQREVKKRKGKADHGDFGKDKQRQREGL